jgi:hypothetical protein
MDKEDRDHFKTIGSRLPAQLGDSPKPPNEANSHSALDQAYCLSRAKVLFACYRKDEAHDPEIYAAAIAATLSDYPCAVVDRATDPRTGIASECKWLPSVAEVREFCDATAQRLHRLAQPIHQRNSAPLSPHKTLTGQSFEEMFAKHGRPIGRFEKAGDKWSLNRQRAKQDAGSSAPTDDKL